MSERNRKDQTSRLPLVSAPLYDPHQAALAFAIDAVADRAWFREHPEVSERQRPASPRELAAHRLPAGTEVVVNRLACGSQLRIFLEPEVLCLPKLQDVA